MTNNKSKTDVAMRDMIFKLMSLARDVPLADAQIRSICDTVTPANVQHTTDLIRRLNTHEPKKKPTTAAIPASSVSTKHSLHKAPVLIKKPFPKCSEPGAVICADTFERLNAFEVQELKKLTKVCPFSLASQPCVRGKQCQLVRLCFVSQQIDLKIDCLLTLYLLRLSAAIEGTGALAHTTSHGPANLSWKASLAITKPCTRQSAPKTTITKSVFL